LDFSPNPADEAFRQDIRSYLQANLPADIARHGKRDSHSARDDIARVMKVLNARGIAAPHWPQENGGTEWSPKQKFIYLEEMRRARVPVLDRTAIDLVGPVICHFANDEQKARFLPDILNGDTFWAQGFSEPNAGSDLASLTTTARREGDHYIVNGQKIWTSEANRADWIFALVRTDPAAKPQKGISFLLIDLKTPGVEVRPIWSIDEVLTLNETFFTDVKVPVENLVGEENMGWTYAKKLLQFERTASAEIPHIKRDLLQAKHLAATTLRRGKSLAEYPPFAKRLAELEIKVMALEWSVMRVLHAEEGDPALNAVASLLKLRGSELFSDVADLCAMALGDHGYAVIPDPEGPHNMRPELDAPAVVDVEAVGAPQRAIFRKAATIYGGANEVQRNIIAKGVLGL
jgi:alkylation response protein AidB-like acyl-CoA dehydrogenase